MLKINIILLHFLFYASSNNNTNNFVGCTGMLVQGKNRNFEKINSFKEITLKHCLLFLLFEVLPGQPAARKSAKLCGGKMCFLFT